MNLQEELLNSDAPIQIISGEGNGEGEIEDYSGKRTLRAIRQRLTKERCGGDRWAFAHIWSHKNEYGDVFVDID